MTVSHVNKKDLFLQLRMEASIGARIFLINEGLAKPLSQDDIPLYEIDNLQQISSGAFGKV